MSFQQQLADIPHSAVKQSQQPIQKEPTTHIIDLVEFNEKSNQLLVKRSNTDHKQMLKGEWLSDKHVNAANKILSRQFQRVIGFEDPLLLSLSNYSPPKGEPFVQIINISNTHWVCASNILSSPDVEVYDSLPHLSMESRSLQSQIATILNCKEKTFQINHIDVQRQWGESDCSYLLSHMQLQFA